MKNKNLGFTYIETIVSLAIVAIISLLIYFCYSTSLMNINKTNISLKNNYLYLQTDRLLRNEISSVIIPAWINDYVYSFDENSITLNYVNGETIERKINLNKSVSISNVNLILYSNKKVAGLSICYSINNNEFISDCLFSSVPFATKKI